jgi:ATP-binding protein involved in chromosome partitioning
MAYSESAALKTLSDIRDPRTGRDIVSAGMLADLIFEEGTLRAVISIDPALAGGFEPVRKSAEDTLSALEGVSKASVILTAHKAAPQVGASPAGVRDGKPKRSGNPHQARRPEGYQGDSQIGTVLAVSSAKGGVGKSTIAMNLAVALAKLGKSVGLLDADIHGPSVPILLGLKGVMAKTVEHEGRRLIKPFTAHGIKAMSIGFLTEDNGPIIWRGPMVQGAISKMLWDVNWGKLDYLIIDMPPGTGDAQLGLAQDIKPKGAIIVSTPQDLALADARKGVKMFEKVDIPIVGLIENMAVFICPDCGNAHHIFGKDGVKREAENMGVTYLGAAPLDMAIRESGDAGVPAAAGDDTVAEIFADMAQAVTG